MIPAKAAPCLGVVLADMEGYRSRAVISQAKDQAAIS